MWDKLKDEAMVIIKYCIHVLLYEFSVILQVDRRTEQFHRFFSSFTALFKKKRSLGFILHVRVCRSL